MSNNKEGKITEYLLFNEEGILSFILLVKRANYLLTIGPQIT